MTTERRSNKRYRIELPLASGRGNVVDMSSSGVLIRGLDGEPSWLTVDWPGEGRIKLALKVKLVRQDGDKRAFRIVRHQFLTDRAWTGIGRVGL